MLMADPAAALAETRRVVRPGGREAAAVWDSVQENPWALLPAQELIERGLVSAPEPGERAPGPFALGDAELVRELLEQAGFTDVELDTIELQRRHDSFEEFWETTLDLSRNFHDAVLGLPEDEIEEVKASLAQRLAPHTSASGAIELPGRTLVAAASA
jgi:SAM-dependent methyltransferase